MSRRRRLHTWLPPLFWVGLIFWASSQPTLPSAPSPLSDVVLKKGLHFAAYGILALLLYRALRLEGFTTEGALTIAFVATVLYGIGDEVHQSFTPNRTPAWYDATIDMIGAGSALLAVRLWRA